MELKKALSITQQISLLRQRGLIIDNEDQALLFLKNNHYYRLNIYFHKFMIASNQFDANVNFSQIIDVYENDSWLRNKMLSILEKIEISIRTHIAYHLAVMYGPDAFYRENIFKNKEKYIQIFKIFSEQIIRNKKDPMIRHHQEKYGGKYPIWVVIELISFNTLSKIFANLLEKDKKCIALSIGNINEYLLGQWLHVLSIQRNICAHYGYLFRRVYSIRPIIANSLNWDKKLDNMLFAQILVMRQLSDHKTWEEFNHIIYEAEKTRNNFYVKDYGFPENWRSFIF